MAMKATVHSEPSSLLEQKTRVVMQYAISIFGAGNLAGDEKVLSA